MKKPLRHRVHDFFLPHERNNYRPYFFGAVSVAAISITILILELGFIAQIALVFPNTNFLASVLPGVLATLTNEARAANNVQPLTPDPLLDKAAQLAANDMAANGYFAHVSPDGKTPWYWLGQVGYQYSYAGENLAVNFSDSQALQTAWMNSPTHFANIVKPEYTRIGFGTATGVYEGKDTTFVVEFFATPPASKVTPVTAPAPVAVATNPEVVHVASTTGTVLGTETPPPQPVAVASQPAPVQSTPAVSSAPVGLLAQALASPATTMEILLAVLFALVAALVAAANVRHWRVPHPHVFVSGALLLALTFGLLAANPLLTGHVQLPPGDSLSASAVSAVGD
jgi:hypothetical protein